jgi:hypothetical protein
MLKFKYERGDNIKPLHIFSKFLPNLKAVEMIIEQCTGILMKMNVY